MPIVSADIKFYLSGGAGNTDPDASLGGVRSTTEVVDNNLHNLFAKVGATEGAAGSTKYRGIYIRNEHGSLTLESAIAYISSQTTSADTELKVSVATEGKNVAMQTIADEDTAPVGESFVTADGTANGLSLGDLETNDFIGLWVQRIVTAGATADASDEATIATRGETTA